MREMILFVLFFIFSIKNEYNLKVYILNQIQIQTRINSHYSFQ